MQDRFKFRIWNETKKYWEERAHISILYSCTELRIYKDTKEGWAQDAKQAGYKLVLEQCTGLKDKNGKLLYDGDIIRHHYDYAKVEWNYHHACFMLVFNDGDNREFGEIDMDSKLFEIVGNIHENLDLLEK